MNKKHSFIDGLLREDVVEDINNAERIKPIQSTVDKKQEDTSQENKKPDFIDRLLGEETVKEMEEAERIQLMRANEQAKTEELKKAEDIKPVGVEGQNNKFDLKNLLVFCLGIFSLIVGVAILSTGQNLLWSIFAFVFIGSGIRLLKSSLTKTFVSIKNFFKNKAE